MYELITHPFEPVFDASSKILILGTLPSPKSREYGFYYGHPQNRFWKVLAALLSEEVPQTATEKKAFLRRNHIALYDVVSQCEIVGASDTSIRNPVPAGLKQILEAAPITRIFANGSKAGQLYEKFQKQQTGIPITVLPSTSSANAAWNLERLCQSWQEAAAALSE